MTLRAMMMGFILLATMTFMAVVDGEEGGLDLYPVFTPCNTTLIKTIKNYWSSTETSQNVRERMEKVGHYVIYYTSFENLTSDFKCVYLDAANSFINFTMTLKNGSSPVRFNYVVTENGDGILSGKPMDPSHAPKYRWDWYTVYVEDGLEIDYVCNDNHGVPTTPLVDVLVGINSFHDSKISQDSQKYKHLMENWGINFTFTSSIECFEEDG